jgi:hypothetical protein
MLGRVGWLASRWLRRRADLEVRKRLILLNKVRLAVQENSPADSLGSQWAR